MSAPLIAAAVGTAGMQYYNSEQNRKANKALQERNEALANGLVLPDLQESDYYGSEIAGRLDPNQLNYGQYQYSGDYAPDQGQYVREVDPRLVEQSANSKFGRDAQVEALKKFQANIASGYDPEFAAKMDQASSQANADAQSRSASILQDAQRRGQMGSNAMLAAQMSRSGQAMQQGAMQSQQAAVEAYKNQLQQQRDASNMGRTLASDENQFAAQNADIINSFNQRASRGYQDYLNRTNEQANQAKLRNLDTQQRLSGANTDMANKQNIDRYNAAQGERSYANKLVGQRQGVRQSNYGNQLSKANVQMGVGNQAMQQNTQNAQDRNAAIQGVGQGFAGYFGQQNTNEQNAMSRKSNEDIARMKYGSGEEY